MKATAELDGFQAEVISAPSAPVAATPPAAAAAAAGFRARTLPKYLYPFPVVRVRGSVAAHGARIRLLRVIAPRSATVKIRCEGDDCPLERRTRHAGRIRAFERFLPAGLRITVRVRTPGYIGKYARLRIRAARPPARRDACLLPGAGRPVSCPPA